MLLVKRRYEKWEYFLLREKENNFVQTEAGKEGQHKIKFECKKVVKSVQRGTW